MTVSYRPFFLDPTIPPEGVEFHSYMHKKGGGRIRPEQFYDGPRQMGQTVGLTFNFEDIRRAPNTTLAHGLIALTPKVRQGEMVEAIYDAFFEHGRDVGNIDVLLELAADLGLDSQVLGNGLSDPALHDQVLAEVEAAYRLGISGVPFFVINGKYAFSGAQPPEIMTNLLREVASREGA